LRDQRNIAEESAGTLVLDPACSSCEIVVASASLMALVIAIYCMDAELMVYDAPVYTVGEVVLWRP